ncbi:MAG: cytochrome c biogenesis protein CcsA [Planctomycetia bacterium]
METALQALSVTLPSLYLLCAILHGMAFAGQRGARTTLLRVWSLRATIVLHAAWFLTRASLVNGFPVIDLASTASCVVFASALVYGILARSVQHAGSGGIVLGMMFIAQWMASAFGDMVPGPRPSALGNPQVLHITTMVLALAAVIVSGVHGALYMLLLKSMRKAEFGGRLSHLPDLELLARIMRGGALIGFLCITIGMNVGIYLAHREQLPGFGYRRGEVLLTMLLWVHFGAIAFSRHIKGFNARRASLAAGLGLAVLLLSLLLILFPAVVFHSRL